VPDDFQKIRKKFLEALQSSDFILFTGGISVGDYDFVGALLEKEKVKEIFYKVKQKPGKPLYFGIKNKRYIFGLPGNPASVLTCYYEYVAPTLARLSNKTSGLQKLNVPLAKSFKKNTGLTHFLKGWYDGKTAAVLQAQESYRLSSFANANCLIQIDEEVSECVEGEVVEIHLL